MPKVQRKKKAVQLLVTCMAIISMIPCMPSFAMTLSERLHQQQGDTSVSTEPEIYADYATVLSEYTRLNYVSASAESATILTTENISSVLPASAIMNDYNGRQAVLDWQENLDSVEWTFQIPETGLYSMQVEYMAGSGTTDIVRRIALDGVVPFDECQNITFLRQWQVVGSIPKNAYGDELSPTMEQAYNWQTTTVADSAGLYNAPFEFYLTAGEHRLSMDMMNSPMYIHSITFVPLEDVLPYEEVRQFYQRQGYTSVEDAACRFEAENIQYVNFGSMRMSSDNDPSVYPLSRGLVRMNVMGGDNWAQGNSTMSWTFHVDKSGLYKLMVRVKNNYQSGVPSYRRIEIDGKVPFKEWEAYGFAYGNRWRSEVLAAEDGTPYEVYLEEGDHTLTMAVRVDELADVVRLLEKDTENLSALSLQIVMITGQNPDPDYDYKIEEKIPDIISRVEDLMGNLDTSMEIIRNVSGAESGIYQQLKQIKDELASLIQDTYYIPSKLNDITNIISEYGDFVTSIKTFPLALDYLQWLPLEEEVQDYKASFFSKLHTMAVEFIQSFTRDYRSVGSVGIQGTAITETIDVWIGRGKDWGELVKRLADEKFTTDTGVAVNMHIVPAGQLNSGSANALLLAVSSGQGPDVALGVTATSVAEFAMRNATQDLKEFSDFEQIQGQFWDELFVPVTYNGGVYALPETVNFKVLMYRKDIINQLGVAIPNTWEDLYTKVLPVLSQNNMQFYYPAELDIMLFQHGAKYYNDELTESALDSPAGYKAFAELCNLYTIYGVPVQADFFNRFRSGEMPMGVGDFTAYIKVLSAAPELYGRWGIALIPGHKQEDGTLNRSQGKAAAESAMILQASTKKKEAWTFLKWWVSDETQTQFGHDIESIVGSAGRWNSANKNAFEAMAWSTADLSTILEALEQIDEVPAVLGGYFTTRHIGNAFNRSVVSQMNIRESLEKAVKDINKELARRRSSMG